MTYYEQSVNQQYGQDNLSAKILSALQRVGKNLDALTRDDLSTFDEFHIGGIAETRSLAQAAGLQPGMHVLDVGSGIGGPARTLAAEFGCRVTGIDLTQEFVSAAEMLTARVGLSDQVTFRHANALQIPFEANTFDVIWTQFAGMNIENKKTLYSEFQRVLKNGGRLVLHEIMAGQGSDLHYPVFWANSAGLNFLSPTEQIQHLLADRGFKRTLWKDVTRESLAWFQNMVERSRKPNPLHLGLDVFIADDVTLKAANILRNLEEKRIVVVQGIFDLKK